MMSPSIIIIIIIISSTFRRAFLYIQALHCFIFTQFQLEQSRRFLYQLRVQQNPTPVGQNSDFASRLQIQLSFLGEIPVSEAGP